MADLDYGDWVGRTAWATDQVTPATAAALAATLDRPFDARDGAELPPLWHWAYFCPTVATAELAPDGHPHRGGFLPPVDKPRRMWAGSRVRFLRSLHVGEPIERCSTIADVSSKDGRSGSFVLVTVRHEIQGGDGPALVEEQDLVYRDAPAPGAPAPTPKPAPTDGQWSHRVEPTPVLLFRYSAVTFNGHRIHYDRPYATEVEGYPGLVVHGPLTATLLLEAMQRERPRTRVAALSFRALRPLFDGAPFHLEGRIENGQARLWTRDSEDALTMELTAALAE